MVRHHNIIFELPKRSRDVEVAREQRSRLSVSEGAEVPVNAEGANGSARLTRAVSLAAKRSTGRTKRKKKTESMANPLAVLV